MPPLSSFPKAHQVTFKYYMGVISFLEEDYARAEELLEEAYSQCHRGKDDDNTVETKNIDLILTYLIPTKMLTKHQLASPALLSAHPRLASLFSPICSAIRSGDLRALDTALVNGEAEFVKRRVYLTLERGRDVAIRNLFRKVFLAGVYEPLKEGQTEAVRRTRVPIDEFAAALQLAGAEVDDGEGGVDRDEVECVIANMIYKVCCSLPHCDRDGVCMPRWGVLDSAGGLGSSWLSLPLPLSRGNISADNHVIEPDERLHRSRRRQGRPQ